MQNERAALIGRVVKTVMGLPHGQIITHIQLEHLLEISRRENPGGYHNVVRGVRSELIRNGRFLQTLHKRGYLIVYPGQEADQCVGKARRGMAAIRRAVTEAQDIRLTEMPPEKRTETISKVGLLANCHGLLSNAFSKIDSLQPAQPESLPPPPADPNITELKVVGTIAKH
jgi:hypothetical protein